MNLVHQFGTHIIVTATNDDKMYVKEGDSMSRTLVQFRIEESARIKAIGICEKLGIDLSTYLRMCVYRLNQENGIPFSMKLEESEGTKALEKMKRASAIAEEYGIIDMSIDEINAEISEVRK